jgi:enoyl-CoA hydratase/carnithine racemase
MGAQLKSHAVGRTLVLTISNPDARNALGPEMYAAGVEALNIAQANPDVRTVVLTGEGAWFSAGGNLQRLLNNREQHPDVQARSIDGLHSWIDAMRTLGKPVLGAVEGAAAGAGFSLVLACDLVVAASDARFVMAYSNVGLSPDGGASWHLGRMLPRQAASALLMFGDAATAAQMAHWGVVNQVSAPGQALVEALSLAERLNQRSPQALASIKDLLSAAHGQALQPHLDAERDAFVANLHSPNGLEGIRAFLDKRTPQYRG